MAILTNFFIEQVFEPSTPVDETAELIERLQVSTGSMSTSQTKEWFTVAKQVR